MLRFEGNMYPSRILHKILNDPLGVAKNYTYLSTASPYDSTIKQALNNLYGKNSNRWFTSLYTVEPKVQRYIDTDIAQTKAMQKKVDEIGQGLRKYDFKLNPETLKSIRDQTIQLMMYNEITKKEKHMNVNDTYILYKGVAYPAKSAHTSIASRYEHTTMEVEADLCFNRGIPVRGFTIANFRDAMPTIKNVIFNNPATIIQWGDGTKTVVKAENETYDPEKGFTMAYVKKMLGNKGNYYNVLRKWLPKNTEPKEETVDISVETLHKIRECTEEVVNKSNDIQAKAYRAYDILRNVYHNTSKPLKADYESAIEEAIGYLGEILD